MHYFVSTPSERDAYVREMLPLAAKYEEYLQFTTIDAAEYPEMLPVYGQPAGSSGVLSVHHPRTGHVFPSPRPTRMTERVDAAAVERFLLDIIEGRVEPWAGDGGSAGGDAGHEEL